jgi:hypothetical protein
MNDRVLNCRIRRARDATERAIAGNDKNLWYVASDLWDKAMSHPDVSSFTKKLYEAGFIRDYQIWSGKR